MQHPVDVYVGKRIRHRRWVNGTTQKQLADAIGIKFQQIQKYEAGTNRVSASRLWDIAKETGVPVSYFFEGYNAHSAIDAPGYVVQGETRTDKESLELLRVYYAIPENQRRRLLNLVRVMGKDYF